MKYLLTLSLLFVLSFSQGQEKKDPKVTEIWEPQPEIVTPGTSLAGPPSDAIVLFNGGSLDSWTHLDDSPAKWKLKDGAMTVVKGTGDIKTKEAFEDVQLHVEWRTPSKVESENQGRGNSGVLLQERYEVQILDNYNNKTYVNGQAGSIYKQHPPLVNACKGPGEWQSYDIIYQAPRFNEKGQLLIPAKVTVLHNGILVQNHSEIWGPVKYGGLPQYKKHEAASIRLQDHGNPVSFRNIWVRKL